MSQHASLTQLIDGADTAEHPAFAGLFEAMYDELRRLARARVRSRKRDPVLDTTSVVHEAYLRFAAAGKVKLADRAHFLRYAAHVMRSVIVDFVRERITDRRGGNARHITLTTQIADSLSGEVEIMRVHDALHLLAKHNARLAQVVEMRYFGGLTEPEVAQALGVGERTVRRDWEKARLLLAAALKDNP
ncbi:MAG TPA: ECF-type sigma factor [Steroidobacteraceae bacterium]